MSILTLSGIFPPVPTPFGTDGALALSELTRNFVHWNSHALAGYVVLGSNGEGVHLNEAETDAVLETARAAIPPDRKMIVGTGRHSTRETVAWSRRAAEVGADAVLVLPPSYYRNQMTRAVLVDHFYAVAEAVPVPVVVYNMPACTGLDLDAETVLEIAAHSNVIGIKDSGGDVAKLAEIVRGTAPEFAVLAGSAGFLLPALSIGASGGVLGLANIAPDACLALAKAVGADDRDQARVIQHRLVRPNRAVTKQWGVPALKAALDMLGLYGGPPRRPLPPLSTTLTRELRTILTAAGLLPAAESEEDR
jgi:4-hydroxy-2-oxoglutarate aldolase